MSKTKQLLIKKTAGNFIVIAGEKPTKQGFKDSFRWSNCRGGESVDQQVAPFAGRRPDDFSKIAGLVD